MFTIEWIKAANARAGQTFFSPATMRFFKSRVLPDVYEGPGGVYFVTSERAPDCPRLYTVRSFDPATGKVATVGEFNVIKSREEAKKKARLFARYSRDIERRLAGGDPVEVVPGFTVQRV